MLVVHSLVRIVIIVYLEVISFDRFYANSRSCYNVSTETICYFQPNEEKMTWDEAWRVCKENNATLPVIDNRMIGEIFKMHGESKLSFTDHVWLAGREIRLDDWQWLNRQVIDQQRILKGIYYSVDYYTNAVIKDFKFHSMFPANNKYHICYYTDSKLCRNQNIIPRKNGCLFVNNDEELNLANARNKCLDEGGDLATFEEDENLDLLKQKNSSLLNDKYKEYWIGLRRSYWIWNETDSSKEMNYSNWYTYLYANHPSKSCLYLLPYNYKWSQDRCTEKKLFLCQTVERSTTSQTQAADVSDKSLVTLPHEPQTAVSMETMIAIIGSILAVVIVALIIVVVVVILKIPRKREVTAPTSRDGSRRSDKKNTVPREKSARQMEAKTSAESNAIVESEESNHYAEIPRAVDYANNDECKDESHHPGIVYATLEFDANKAIYEEPDVDNQRKQQGNASKKLRTLKRDDQPTISAESFAQPHEGTIYANM